MASPTLWSTSSSWAARPIRTRYSDKRLPSGHLHEQELPLGPAVGQPCQAHVLLLYTQFCEHLFHICLCGSMQGVLDLLANRCLAQGTNAWTDVDHTCYTVTTAGSEGFLNLLPIYLDHILYPTLTVSPAQGRQEQSGKTIGLVQMLRERPKVTIDCSSAVSTLFVVPPPLPLSFPSPLLPFPSSFVQGFGLPD